MYMAVPHAKFLLSAILALMTMRVRVARVVGKKKLEE